MGLFWNSKLDDTKREIARLSIPLNHTLKSIESCLIKNNGITLSNLEEMSNLYQTMNEQCNKIVEVINQLSSREASTILITWVDGRSIPIYLWEASIMHIGRQGVKLIEELENKF